MPVSIYEVAKAAGVSVGSVSRVLNGAPNVGEKTRKRVTEAVDSLGYRPNKIARSLASGQSMTLAMLVPELDNPFFGEIAFAVQSEADKTGRVVLIYATNDEPANERGYLKHMLDLQVDGLIIVDSVLDALEFKALVGSTPVVHIDHLDAPGGGVVLGADQAAGAVDAVRHLVGLGHGRIALITGSSGTEVAAARFRGHCESIRDGYAQGLAEAGIAFEPELIAAGEQLNEVGGHQAAVNLVGRVKFTAVVAATDLMALGAINALQASGLTVPDDVSVVGYDDIRLAPFIGPGLTTVKFPVAEVAQRAIELVTARRRRYRGQIPTELIVRGSTAPPRRANRRDRRG